MMLNQAKLKAALMGRPFRFFPAIPSTNDVALAWLREGGVDGSIVITDHQTSGRGREGRGWYTPPGTALTASIILHCHAEAALQSTMLAAVAVYELLQEFAIEDIGIKWPNDVQIGERKVCGILPEALWDDGSFVGVVLGIGLNVRIDFAGTPLAETAVSLETIIPQRLDRCQLLQQLLRQIDHWREHLGTVTLYRAWRARLNTLGRPVTIGEESGIASAVDTEGALWLELPDGQQKRILAGTVMGWKELD